MSKQNRYATSLTYGLSLALLALLAFVVFDVYFLLAFAPLVVFFMWRMNNQIKDLQKRLAETARPAAGTTS